MIRTYASLCDSRYLPQALALHESLQRHSSELFRLYLLPLDEECARTARALALPHLELVPLDAFEVDQGLCEARSNRTRQEYAWTCASNLCEFLMKRGLSEITYLDADMMAFSDTEVIFAEMGDKSISAIPHRFPEYDRARLEPNGKFNVCWNTFRDTSVGRECLARWAEQVRRWCYYRNEDGKFGDQGFLDEWPSLYGDELHIIGNIGAGLAPWNLQQYQLTDGPRVDGQPVIFFHYHEYIHDERLTNYPLRQVDRELIYFPYMSAVSAAKARIALALQSRALLFTGPTCPG